MSSTIQVDKIQDQGGNTIVESNGSGVASTRIPTTYLGTGTASSSTFLRGDQTYAAVAAGGYAFISKSTIGANTATLEITGLGTTYESYRFIINGLYTDSGSNPRLLFQTGDSGGYETGSNYHSGHVYITTESSAGGGYEQLTDTGFRLCDAIGTNTNGELSGWFDIYNHSTSGKKKRINFHFQHRRSAGGVYDKIGGGTIAVETAEDRIKFYLDTGEMEGGTVYAYGMVQA